ncbi:4-phytase [Methanocorpusculum labreanum Z]|uniref:4-phytase n=1 Tax=Methanocorpusculum labreanum (strain ATCC 43576 / DSM 4855 / Z) TaxID=410358 RepID=A2SRD8_METLZ|nr:ABC transporter substrate-binding protein [Methanocorpusculum labreanum]ABN06894.1 4-phytase [Methanocorpusculum labreanum Z]
MQSGFQKIILLISIAVLLIAAVCVAGCVQSSDSGEKVLRLVEIEGPDTGGSLDPANGWEGWYVDKAGIYETLFAYDPDMVLQPKLATGYKLLNDTTWEITLRKGVTFHDGTPFNADAVIFSFNRVLNASNSRAYEYAFIEDVRKTDDYTIIIETNKPYAPLIASLVDPIMSIVSPNIVDVNKQPVGTGPFVFSALESGASLDVVRNENYWGGKVGLAGVNTTYIGDATARTLLIKSGDADVVRDILPSEYAAVKNAADTHVESKAMLRTYFVYMNENKAPFNDVRVRQALSYAVNRQEIVDTALEGVGGVVAVGPFSYSSPWNANDEIESYAYNKEKALALLAEAGILPGADGKLYYNGKPFTIEITTYSKRAALPPTLEVIAAQYEDLGITVNTRIMESSAIKVDVAAGNYDMTMAAWSTMPTGDPDYFLSRMFFSTAAYASTWLHYSNPEVDELILKASTTFDQAERAELYDEIQNITQNDAGLIYLFYESQNWGVGNDVLNLEIYPNEYTMMTKDITIT